MENNNKMAAVSCGHIGSGSGAVLGEFRSSPVTSFNEFRLDFLIHSIPCFIK